MTGRGMVTMAIGIMVMDIMIMDIVTGANQ
jgi:hypothetical protein